MGYSSSSLYDFPLWKYFLYTLPLGFGLITANHILDDSLTGAFAMCTAILILEKVLPNRKT